MRCKRADKNKSKTFFLDFKTTINLKFEFRSCKKRFTTNSMFNYATLGAALNTITASISFLLFVFVCLSISLTLSLPVHLLLCMCLYFCVTFSRHPFLFIILNVYLQRVWHSVFLFHFPIPLSPCFVFWAFERTNEHPRVFHRMPNTDFAIAHFASSINMSTIRFSVIWVHFF